MAVIDKNSATVKLVFYCATLVSLLFLFECLARAFEAEFQAVADRIEFKKFLIRNKPDSEIVIIGTSRMVDGIGPMSEVISHSMNASVPSSSVETLLDLSLTALNLPAIRSLVVELSPSQLRHDLTRHDDSPQKHLSALIQYRRALTVDNLPRFAGVLFPQLYDGSEWFRRQWLLNLVRPEPKDELPFPAPTPVCFLREPTSASNEDLSVYKRIAEEAAVRNVHLYIVIPPSRQDANSTECTQANTLAEATSLATRRPVLSFECQKLPPRYFHDAIHLNAVGRKAFTASLKNLLASHPECPTE